jgi:large subunit ribosomal protein L25
MANLKLEANYRSDMSKSRMKQLRREGYVTASVFGREAEPVSLEIKLKDIVEQLRHSDQGIMSLFDVTISGAPSKCDGTVIIKEFHKNPLTRRCVNIQFQRVSMKEKINVSVPVVLVGEAAGVRDGGIVEQIQNELGIRTLPGNIPPRIEVDVTGLAIGHHIRATDLPAMEGVEIMADADTLICTCVPPHVVHEKPTEAEVAAAAAAEAGEVAPSESGE